MSGVKGRSGGHNRKPTAIKALDGTLKPSRVNPNEPTSPALEKVPRCPGHLKGEARRAWRSVGQKLTDMGVLTEVDLHALEAYCVVFARWREAETHLEGDDALMTLGGGATGLVLVPSPYLKIAEDCLKQMRAWMNEFGITPSSRSRVKVKKKESGSEEEDWFNIRRN